MLRSNCDIYYESAKRRLVYLGRMADEDYWDSHWLSTLKPSDIHRSDRFVVGVTKKYLPLGAKVVDAGCGIARTVFGLDAAGYDAYGVDYAPETVSTLNKLAPDLKVSLGDVRNLTQFESGYFDGVWSLGVIEHFYDGYEAILAETLRVLKPGGYAFVTVPGMSPLRRMKAAFGVYPAWESQDVSSFYQFALMPSSVIENFERAGFKLVATRGRGGFKGLKDELGLIRPLLQRVYDSESLPLRACKAAIDKTLSGFSFHTKLYVFRKPSMESVGT